MSERVIRSFQRWAYAWLALYLTALLLLGGDAWTNAPVKVFTARTGPAALFQHALDLVPAEGLVMLCALGVFGSLLLLRRHRWWIGLAVWFLYRLIDHRMWLASNGGLQLMGTMLLWAALMGEDVDARVRTFSFWAARLQLLLVYAAAAAHKFTGTTWLDGTAMLRVANDPLFHLHWLAAFPALCAVITYAVLAWMTLFPLAVWWWPSRRIVLCFGVAFHLLTALFIGIPQMGLAFIACYPLWWHRDTSMAVAVTSPPSRDQGH